MKMIILPILLGLVACSGPGPKDDVLQTMVLFNLLPQDKNFKITKFDTEEKMELKTDLQDGLKAVKVRYIVSLSAEATKECRYNKTSVFEKRAAFSGSFSGGNSPLQQDIHECYSTADIDTDVNANIKTWKERLGDIDYSNCGSANPMFCNGTKITEEWVEKTATVYRKDLEKRMSKWKLIKVGEEIEIPSQYIIMKNNGQNDEWSITAMGLYEKK